MSDSMPLQEKQKEVFELKEEQAPQQDVLQVAPMQMPLEIQQQDTTQKDVKEFLKGVATGAGAGEYGEVEKRLNVTYVEDGKVADDSISYQEMENSYNELMNLLRKSKKKEVPPSELMGSFLRVSEAADAYLAHHNKRRISKKGRDRRAVALDIKRLMRQNFTYLGGIVQKEKPVQKEKEEISEKEGEAAEDRLKEFSDHYAAWDRSIGSDYSLDEPEEKLRKRFRICRIYADDVERYRTYMEGKKMPDSVRSIIEEYDEIMMKCQAMKWSQKQEKKTGVKQGAAMSTLRGHLKEVTDNKKDEKTLDEEEVDAGLTKEQLAGLNEIDRWFIRNYNNGGIAGRFFSSLKNKNDESVMRLLSLTKRERLHIYYLIETDARKHASRGDVAASQASYVPNLAAFKKKMTAHKLKFAARATGGYTYMHKLDEAMHISREYKEEVRYCGQILKRDEKEEKKDSRLGMMKDIYGWLAEYQKKLKEAQDAQGEDKKRLEKEAKALGKKTQKKLVSLIERAKAENFNQSKQRVANRTNNDPAEVTSHLGYVASLGAQLDTGANIVGLEAFSTARLVTGDIGAAFATAGQLMASALAIYNAISFGSSMNTTEFGLAIGDVVSTGLNAIQAGSKAAVVAHVGQEALFSPAMMIVGGVAAGASAAINITKGSLALGRRHQASSARHYFEEKEKQRLARQQDEMTEEERLQAKKDRYAVNMTRLSQQLNTKNAVTSGIKTLGNAATMVGVMIPGAGTVMALVGVGLTMVASIADILRTTSIQQSIFDNYYQTEALYDKLIAAKPEWKKKDKKPLMKSIRRSLAAADGYSNVKNASEHVARVYAVQAREILFDANATKEDKDAYTQLVHSLGLSVNIEKGRPTVEMLARKMSCR